MADPNIRDRIIQIVVGGRGQSGALLYALGESGDIYTLDDRYENENARWTRVRVSPLLRKRPKITPSLLG